MVFMACSLGGVLLDYAGLKHRLCGAASLCVAEVVYVVEVDSLSAANSLCEAAAVYAASA